MATKPAKKAAQKKSPSKKKDNRFKVFGFMNTAHSLTVVAENGVKIDRVDVESEEHAKELFTGEKIHNLILDKIDAVAFQTIFVNDPGTHEALIEACRIMEESKADTEPASTTEAAQGQPDCLSVRTRGTTFCIMNPDGTTLAEDFDMSGAGINSLCKFRDPDKEYSDQIYIVVGTPKLVDEENPEKGHFIFLAEYRPEEEKSETQESPEPETEVNYPATGTLKTVQVPMPPTVEQLFDAIRRLKIIEAESSMSAASYREDIKTAKKALMDMEGGMVYTSMECEVLNDWEAGERRFLDPKTREVMLTEKIPDRERQIELKLTPDKLAETSEHLLVVGPDYEYTLSDGTLVSSDGFIATEDGPVHINDSKWAGQLPKSFPLPLHGDPAIDAMEEVVEGCETDSQPEDAEGEYPVEDGGY